MTGRSLVPRLGFAIVALAILTGCEGSLSPFCVATSGADVETRVKYRCPLSAEEKRTFDAILESRQRQAQAHTEAVWEAKNPGSCPPRLTQPYDYRLAAQYDEFMRSGQFAKMANGYGQPVQRVYVPTPMTDQMLTNMRATMEQRATMCRANNFKPAGFMPPIFEPYPRVVP